MEKNQLENLIQAQMLLENAKSLLIQTIAKIEDVKFENEYCLDILIEATSGCSEAIDQIKQMGGLS